MNDFPRIVFMGTPEIAQFILKGLIDENYNIVGVVSQTDKPKGRKGIISPTPTKEVALENNIPCFQPIKIKSDYDFLKELKPDLIITCAYGQIVPNEVLEIPTFGSINVHGSLLPKYRGASPIQQALINGDLVTGVTIMEMIDRMDAGRMYAKEEVVIDNDNYTSLYEKIGKAGLHCLLKMLPQFIQDKINHKDIGIVQDEKEVTFCGKIKKEDEHLSLSFSCDEFVNMVNALSYTPGGYLLYDNQIFKILRAKKVNNLVNKQIGEIVEANKNGILLQLKDGQISLLEVQKQGKSKMDYKSYLNGDHNMLGKVLK
ncbi:MAG: methionyl-tRNA formyltransferase [Bacillales bacterium]|nr:methionyl-tRNA formyltransferase [Bacillales bacterium]